ncbi:hypothetical protein RSAG8_08544, partial [Rhizoctonia solani AG-8 WAC10335]
MPAPIGIVFGVFAPKTRGLKWLCWTLVVLQQPLSSSFAFISSGALVVHQPNPSTFLECFQAMQYFNLVTLHRSCISIGPCRQFNSGNVLRRSHNRPTRLSKGGYVRPFYATAISQNAVVNQVQTGAKPKVPIKKKRSSVEKLAGSNVLLGDTKSDTKRALNNTDNSRTTDNSHKKLDQLRKHIKRFFAEYPKFTYDPTKPYTEEFIRMTQEFEWLEDSKEYKAARKKLNAASVLQFNENFDKEHKSKSKKGNDSESKKESEMLRKWIRLFDRIDIKDPVMPKTVPEFEERVKSVHTNICDVLDADVTGEKSTDWGNEVILSQYTRSTKKIFSGKRPPEDTLLHNLLRHIWSPSATRGFEKAATQKEN